MGTNTATVMTLANSIIGVSVLAMPFCFKQCGIGLSILMLVCSSFVSRLACHFLLKAAIMARRRNFEFLAFHIFGPTGKFTAELFIIGFLMGTCIAFFVVMGDLGPAIVAKALGIGNTDALRPSVLIGLAVFVVLPLGLLRNVDSLASICTVTIGFYGCLVLKVMAEATPHLLAGDWLDKVHLWRPAGIMQCIPIFSMALFCQTQLFEIYESLHNASLERMNDIIRAAVNMCTTVYICVGFFGYVAYCTLPFTGNVMMSFTPSALSEVIKVGFVLSVAVSFPLVVFPCRASLYSLLFRRTTVPHHEVVSGHIPETRFKCLTVFIISVALLVGLLIPNIELVLGLVGSTIGVLICVMFPAAAFIRISSKSSYERLLAQVLLFVGALILVLGTYATLYAAHENVTEIAAASAQPDVNKLHQVPIKLDPLLQKLEETVHHDDPLEQKAEAKVKMKADTVELPATAEARQEPPVPIEPQDDPKVVVKEPQVLPDIVNKPAPIEPKSAAADTEPEKKEEPKLVDQDAIRKEDEELAEAEKSGKSEAQKKDAELLRKLEKHQEEQMKLLKEQKQILQALQERKKETDRSKNLTIGVVKESKDDVQKVAVPLNIKNVDTYKLNVPEQQQEVPKKALEQRLEVPMKPSIPEQKIVVPEKLSIPQKIHLLPENDIVPNQQIAPLENLPENEDRVKKNADYKIPFQTSNVRGNEEGQKNNLVPVNDGVLAKVKVNDMMQKVDDSLKTEFKKTYNSQQNDILQDKSNIPQPSFKHEQNKPKEKYSSPLLNKQDTKLIHDIPAPVPPNFILERLKSPVVPLDKPKIIEQESKVVQRDILQKVAVDSTPKEGRELLDREKRETEEENCAKETVVDKVNNNYIVEKPKTYLVEPKIESHLVEENNTAIKSASLLTDSKPDAFVPQKVGEVLSKEEPSQIKTAEEQNASLIKSPTHLTDPNLQPLVPQKIEENLPQAGILQDAKPMKRDLKSLINQQEKDK